MSAPAPRLAIQDRVPTSRPRLDAWIGPACVAVAVAVVMAGVRPGHVLGSTSVDGHGTQWFFWFAGEVLAGRQAPGWTDLLFYPWGKALYTHTGGNLLDAWLAVPLRWSLGATAGFNLWIAWILATNAWAGARLAGALGVTGGSRWAAGVALVLNPYVLAELDLGRPTQAWIAPAGLALAALMQMRTAGQGALAGGLIAVTALGYWYYGLLLGGFAASLGAWRLAFGPERRRVFLANLVAVVVALAGVYPFAAPMLGELGAGAVPGLLAVDGAGELAPLALRTAEGDSQGLYIVAPLLGQAGSLLEEGALRFNPGLPAWTHVHTALVLAGAVVLLGEVRSAGAGGGVAGGAPPRPKRLGAWWVAGVLAALFVASGPVIVAGGTLVVNHPWIAGFTGSDVLRRWWWPGRAVAFAHLLAAPLVGAVLAAVRPVLARGLVGVALLAVVAAPLHRDALLPLATWDAAPPPLLTCLSRAAPGAVIDLPLLTDQKNLWFQTVHGHPILGGMLLKKPAFAPRALAVLRSEDGLVAALDVVGAKQYTRALSPVTPDQRATVVARGYRYVLARIDAFARPRTNDRGETTWTSEWSRARRQIFALLGAPAVEDASFAIWSLDEAKLDCAPR